MTQAAPPPIALAERACAVESPRRRLLPAAARKELRRQITEARAELAGGDLSADDWSLLHGMYTLADRHLKGSQETAGSSRGFNFTSWLHLESAAQLTDAAGRIVALAAQSSPG